jgi:hypothetical protein
LMLSLGLLGCRVCVCVDSMVEGGRSLEQATATADGGGRWGRAKPGGEEGNHAGGAAKKPGKGSNTMQHVHAEHCLSGPCKCALRFVLLYFSQLCSHFSPLFHTSRCIFNNVDKQYPTRRPKKNHHDQNQIKGVSTTTEI